MDGVTLLLHEMTEVETSGRMSESFATDNKKDLHTGSCFKEYDLINDEILPGFCQLPGRVSTRCCLFGDEAPRTNIKQQYQSQENDGNHPSDKADNRGINSGLFARISEDPPAFALF
jgi:hypothetical protein